MAKVNKTFIIAEIGVNHNGSIKTAKKLIDIAKKCGADAVKFQTFLVDEIVTKYVKKANYQKLNEKKSSTQFEMLSKLEFSNKDFLSLRDYCKKKNIEFMSTPFDIQSAKFLETLSVKKIKIASGEITNLPLLKYLGSLNKNLILSTGMAKFSEVNAALMLLISSGTSKSKITILQCTTDYPASYSDVNLNAMISMKNKLKIKIGYSDHTLGIEVPIAAVALGAQVIEKHITIDKKMKGPDHKSSLEEFEFNQMVKSIRNIETSMGISSKKPSSSESKNLNVIRKFIVASSDIKKGEFFSKNNIGVKRSQGGISPMNFEKILGNKAKKNYKKDQIISV